MAYNLDRLIAQVNRCPAHKGVLRCKFMHVTGTYKVVNEFRRQFNPVCEGKLQDVLEAVRDLRDEVYEAQNG